MSSEHEPTGPRDARESVFMTASLASETGGVATTHRIRNLSRSGVCLDCRDPLAEGTRMTVSIGMESLPGVVIWVRRGQAGLRFERDLDLVAARQKPHPTSVKAQGGWMADMSNPYRR